MGGDELRIVSPAKQRRNLSHTCIDHTQRLLHASSHAAIERNQIGAFLRQTIEIPM
jgi:hypothetical protein